MGAIQNSLNSITAAVTGAVVAGVHAEEAAAQKKEQGLLAKAQHHEDAAAAIKNAQDTEAAQKAIDEYNSNMSVEEAQRLVDSAVSKKQKKTAMKELKAANQRFTSKQAAEYSMAILSEEREAIAARMQREQSVMKRGGIK